jgi:DNA-binding transcriptional ArsR family regulator
MIEKAGQSCAIGSALYERIHQPYHREGQRTGALRFGDPRVMALVGALCIALNAAAGFTNRSLRAQVAGLLATTYTASQMTYDLRRLRRKGLIRRVPRSNSYILTPDGIRVAIFYTKLYGRLLRPLLAVDYPPSSPELRQAFHVIDTHVTTSIDRARLPRAA